MSICSYAFEPEYVHDILDSDDEARNDDDDDSNGELWMYTLAGVTKVCSHSWWPQNYDYM